MPRRRLLIIAPDSDLRRSLEFLLEAAGYAVTPQADIATIPKEQLFDCAVLDHRAIERPGSLAELQVMSGPIVLLAGSTSPWLEDMVFRVVRKPLLGEPLIAAVEAALRSAERGRGDAK